MKSFYTAALWLLATTALFSQRNTNVSSIRETVFFAKTGNPDWLTIRPGVAIAAADLVRLHKADLGLGEHDELVPYRTNTDAIGFVHHRYQQYHRGVKVDGGELLIHEKEGRVRTLNGKLVRGLQAGVRPALPASRAVEYAQRHVPADRYIWESPQAEALLRRVKNDPTATFYPKPELVLVAPDFAQGAKGFQLAWHLTVHTLLPEETRKELFISAEDGSLVDMVDNICTENTPGTAQTKYSGPRDIITEQMPNGQYRLVETTRGNGIETYNMQRTTNYDVAVNFTDADNQWNNFNIAKDEAATDAHWGAEMTYDYYLNYHQHHGLDGLDKPLISFVHYSSAYENAFWNGSWASYGDGSGLSGPFSSLDVVAHEFTHGVTEFSAHLRYRNESGALNESFSDVFGSAVEFVARPERANWLVGEDIYSNGSPFRDMADPKQETNPDTYKGEFWATGAGDNGGVHTNSGVQNHWFYLLTEGGSGTNDNGDAYAVTALGLDTAADIAFRNLQYYLVTLSNYADAREGAIQAAEDLYGICSEVFVQTANAWYAVGVGRQYFPNDLAAIRISEPAPVVCGFTGTELLSVQFRYDGCNTDLQAGDRIPVAYLIDGQQPVWDTLVLAASLTFGDEVGFTFATPPAQLAVPGFHTLRCWADFDPDLNADNDETVLTLESIAGQNTDVRMRGAEQPATGCFLGVENPIVEVGFWGCDSLPAGTEIVLSYSVDGSTPVSEVVPVPVTLFTGQVFFHKFAAQADLATIGTYSINFWAHYAADNILTNDSLNNYIVVHPAPMYRSDMVNFESVFNAAFDTLLVVPGSESEATIRADAARTGTAGLRITGGDFATALATGKAQEPTLTNAWALNRDFISQVCLCADLSGLASAELQFDLKQTFSFFYVKKLGAHNPYGSMLRLLADGEPLGDIYRATTPSFDQWKTRKEDLKDYLGGTVQICFESFTGISSERDTFGATSFGDRVLLDNITIVGQPTIGTVSAGADEPEWSVQPNPGNGFFTVAVRADEAQPITITVDDALGRTIRSQNATLGAGRTMIPLHLDGAVPGVYFVRLYMGGAGHVRRVVVRQN
ncbi:MAG: M4 family metallopeptidase [Saprospiraceae bacterium]